MTYEIQFELAPLNSILSFYLFILSFLLFTIQSNVAKIVQNLLSQPDLTPKLSNENWKFFTQRKNR